MRTPLTIADVKAALNLEWLDSVFNCDSPVTADIDSAVKELVPDNVWLQRARAGSFFVMEFMDRVITLWSWDDVETLREKFVRYINQILDSPEPSTV